MENKRKYVKMKGPSTIYMMDPCHLREMTKIKHPSKSILKIALNNHHILLYAFF